MEVDLQDDAPRGAGLDAEACYRALRARDARYDGRFFTAVTTTHIYCRPVCPARTPRRTSCRFYASAAAAQAAGFRPCLRCRPETSPGTPAWLGTSSTVARALRLIRDGALSADGVDDLGERVGIGARHLRRLFLRHLGATPIAVAQTQRTLFAKQLLDETDLPMTEVALAAGFASVRRFNTAMRQIYRRPPSELRRGRVAHPRPNGESPGLRIALAYRPPYDWSAIAAYWVRAGHPASRPRARRPTGARCVSAIEPAGSKSRRCRGSIVSSCTFTPARRRTPCYASSAACANCSTWMPILPRSAPTWRTTSAWRRSSPRDRACASPAPGMASNSRCAPSWDNR